VRRIAIFGNAGGGKSTLARKLAELTQIPLYPVDMLQFKVGGDKVPHDDYLRTHAELLQGEAWILDGYGDRKSAWERFARADTLIYVDLPLLTHFRWVTKRLFKGIFATPEGWPKGSPMLRSTLDSYRVLWLCHRHLTPKYREMVAEARQHKRVHHLRSPAEMAALLLEVETEIQRAKLPRRPRYETT
jgi:adenylate kinase family enzyme